MVAIYNPWGGMGNVSPVGDMGENPWVRFKNTGSNDRNQQQRPMPREVFRNVSPGGMESSLDYAKLFASQPFMEGSRKRFEMADKQAREPLPFVSSRQKSMPFLAKTNPSNKIQGPVANILNSQKEQVRKFDTDPTVRMRILEEGKRMGLWGPGAETDPTIANFGNQMLSMYIENVKNPKRNEGGLGHALKTFLPIALSIAAPAIGTALSAPAAAGAGVEAAAAPGTWAVGAGESLGGGLGSAFGATEGAAMGAAGATGAGSDIMRALATYGDPIEMGINATDLVGANTFTEAAQKLGFNTFEQLAGAINPDWIARAATASSMNPRVKNTLVRSAVGAGSNPDDPLRGAVTGAISANLPSVSKALTEAGLPEWASKGAGGALNNSITQLINTGRINPSSVLKSGLTGASSGLNSVLGLDPGTAENATSTGLSATNLLSGLDNRSDFKNSQLLQMALRGFRSGEQSMNTPENMFDPTAFLQQSEKERAFETRKRIIQQMRAAAAQEEFMRRKQGARTSNPELFSQSIY